jgi:telomerase reverse transcriptase
MPHLLKELGLRKLREFLRNYNLADLPSVVDRIYIRTDDPPAITSFANTLRGVELVAHAVKRLLSQDPQNHLCAGYAKQPSGLGEAGFSVICHCPNASLVFLKSHEWSMLMRCIGDELTLFLLTKCTMVQEVDGRYVFLAGRFKSLAAREDAKKGDVLNRCVIFQKHIRKVGFSSKAMFEYVFAGHDTSKYRRIQDSMKGCLDRMEFNSKKLALTPIFTSLFSNELDVEHKHDVMQCAVEPARVLRFLSTICRKLLKGVLHGHNFGMLRAKISLFVHRNRYETMGREELMRYFRVSELAFFSCRRCSRHEATFRSKVVHRFFKYVFEHVLIPVISRYFYSTEASFSRFKVYYFPRASWRHFSSIYTEIFLEKFEKTQDPPPTYSEIRCIPKKRGVRPIVNMSKSTGGGISINRKVYPEFCVLRGEVGSSLENSVLSYEQIYEKAREYLMGCDEPQYIVKLDLASCFDNIGQDELVRLISGLFSKKKYCLKSFVLLEKSCGELRQRVVSKVVERVRSAGPLMKSLDSARNRIVKEIVTQKILLRNEMIDNLIDVVKGHVVKYENEYYVQRVGIAQGSVVSTLLCSIYFAHLDKLYLNKVVRRGMVLRYVDDFLVMTPDVEEIKGLLRVLESLSHLGVHLSTEKIESNFGVEECYKNGGGLGEVLKTKFLMSDRRIAWCGSVVGNRGFSIKPHYLDKYFAFSVAHSSIRPGTALVAKMRRLLVNKMALLYINKHNVKVYENIFDSLFFCGKKLALFLGRMGFVNPSFALRLLEKSRELVFEICADREIGITRAKLKIIADKAFRESGILRYIGTKGSKREATERRA